MLCSKCSNIVLKRVEHLTDAQKSLVQDRSVENVYYFHHDDRTSLQKSSVDCSLCRKIWLGFSKIVGNGELPPSTPVILWLWIPKDVAREGRADTYFECEILRAECGGVRTSSSFDAYIPKQIVRDLEILTLSSPGYAEPTLTRRASCIPDNSTMSDGNMAMARSWMDACADRHKPCHTVLGASELPTRVIDVSQPHSPRLVSEKGRLAEYVTFSYVWGKSVQLKTLKENVEEHHQLIPTNKLPKTIMDAVLVTKALGFSYLWVDALCILQDCLEDLEREVATMGRIYKNSSLTIAAAVGTDSDAGLSSERDAFETKPTIMELKAEAEGWTFSKQVAILGFEWYHSPHVRSPLDDRAWVIQEQVLSKRSLLFTADRMTWKCLCDAASETKPGMKEMTVVDERITYSKDPFKLLSVAIRDISALENLSRWPQTHERHSILDQWYEMVQEYSLRSMSYFSDTIVAISGISSSIRQVYPCYDFVAGLCLEDLQLGLLWKVRSPYAPEHGWHMKSKMPKRSRRFQRFWPFLPNPFTSKSQGTSDAESQSAGLDWDFADEFVLVPQYGGQPVEAQRQRGRSLAKPSLRAISPPSWSWISQQKSGKGVLFEHRRRYVRDIHLGMQFCNVKFVNPAVSRHLQQEGPTIALQVRAFVKHAILSTRYPKTTGCYTLTAEIDGLCTRTVADLQPDSTEDVSYGDTIACILCAVARAQYDRTLKTPTMYTGIAATPASDGSNFYRRVGLAIITNNEWFANVDNEPQVELTLI